MAEDRSRLVKLVLAAAAAIVAEHAMVLTDGAIAGRIFGPAALGAMYLIVPMFSFVTLVAIAFGFDIAYQWFVNIGRKDQPYAAAIVRQGFIGAGVIGFVLLGFAALVDNPYVGLFDPNENTLKLFDEYWGWFSLVIIFKMYFGLLLCLVYADGAKLRAIVGYCVHFLVNVLFAYLLCTGWFVLPEFGMEGISLGTVIAYAVGIAVFAWHFRDRGRCHIRFRYDAPALPAKPPLPVASRYQVLRGSEVTLDDLNGVIELDKMSLDSCYQVSACDDYELFKSNPENGLIIRDRESGAIVGYSMLLPIRQDMYEKIKTGTFVDTDFKPEMTFRYDQPGIYHLYFASVVVHPEHRSAALILTMLDAMVEDFIALAEKRGIWFSDMIADVVSNDGAKFCRLFGLKKVCETNHNSFIYEVPGLPPGIRETTPATKKLVKIYREKYETL